MSYFLLLNLRLTGTSLIYTGEGKFMPIIMPLWLGSFLLRVAAEKKVILGASA